MNESDTNRRVLTLFLIGTAVYGLTLILCLIIKKHALTAAISAVGAIAYIAFALYLLWLRRSGFNLSESARLRAGDRKRETPGRSRKRSGRKIRSESISISRKIRLRTKTKTEPYRKKRLIPPRPPAWLRSKRTKSLRTERSSSKHTPTG